jgi:hypothetical protein
MALKGPESVHPTVFTITVISHFPIHFSMIPECYCTVILSSERTSFQAYVMCGLVPIRVRCIEAMPPSICTILDRSWKRGHLLEQRLAIILYQNDPSGHNGHSQCRLSVQLKDHRVHRALATSQLPKSEVDMLLCSPRHSTSMTNYWQDASSVREGVLFAIKLCLHVANASRKELSAQGLTAYDSPRELRDEASSKTARFRT